MEKRELIKRSLDTSNAFIYNAGNNAEAAAVNPNIWDFNVRDYIRKNLVVVPLAEQFDFRSPGVDFRVTIDEAPSEASSLTETTDVSISSFTTRYVTFTPSEYGAAYQITDAEAARSFFNVADRMVNKLGYSLVQKRDSTAVSTLQSGAGNSVLVNGKSAATDIASTDTLNYAAITKAVRLMEADLYQPKTLLVNYFGKQQLLDLSTVNKVNEFGTRDALSKGLVGSLFGVDIYVSHSIPTANSRAVAIMLGTTPSGEKAFGFAIKRDPKIEKQYFARGRYWDIVATEEWDVKVLHADGICTITHYAA